MKKITRIIPTRNSFQLQTLPIYRYECEKKEKQIKR